MSNVILVGGHVIGSGGSVLAQGGGIGTPAFFQNFDALTPGSGDTLNGQSGTVDNTVSYSSPNSTKSTIASGAFNFGWANALPITNQPAEGNEIWFRFRTFFPTGFDFTSSPHLKFIRIDTGTTPNGHGSHIDWYILNGGSTAVGYFDFIYEGVNSWLFGGAAPTPVPTGIIRNQWQTWEVYYYLSSVASTAIIRFWRDGTLICDTSNNIPSGVGQRSTINSGYIVGGNNGTAQGEMIITYWNGGSSATQSGNCDDFTVYTSLTGDPVNRDANGNLFIGTGPP